MHADDLYELISDRAVNSKPLILTSNRAPKTGTACSLTPSSPSHCSIG